MNFPFAYCLIFPHGFVGGVPLDLLRNLHAALNIVDFVAAVVTLVAEQLLHIATEAKQKGVEQMHRLRWKQ